MGRPTVWRVCRLRVHVWVLARLLPALVHRLKFERLLARMTPPASRTLYRGLDPAFIVRCVLASTRWPVLMRRQRCLRQGLLAFYFLRLAGVEAVLHLGLEPASLRQLDRANARGHAWVSVAGRCVLNPPTPTMTEVHRVGDRRSNTPAAPDALSVEIMT